MGHQWDRDDGDERRASEADSGTDTGPVLRGELDTVRRASAVESVSERSVLSDRLRSFLRGRRLSVAGTHDGDRPVVEPCLGETGFLTVAGDTVVWPATALADERRSLVGPDARRPLSLFAAAWSGSPAALRVAGTVTRQPSPPGEAATEASTDWYVLEAADAGFDPEASLPTLTVGDAPADEATESHRTTYDRLVAAAEQVVCAQRLAVLGTPTGDGAPLLTPLTGPLGFVQVLDAHTIAWPVYRDAVPVAALQEAGTAALLVPDSTATDGMVQLSGPVSRYDSVAGATDPSPGDRADDWLLMDVERATVSRDPPLPPLSVAATEPPWASDG